MGRREDKIKEVCEADWEKEPEYKTLGYNFLKKILKTDCEGRPDIDLVENFVQCTSRKYQMLPDAIRITNRGDNTFSYMRTFCNRASVPQGHLSMVVAETLYDIEAKSALMAFLLVKEGKVVARQHADNYNPTIYGLHRWSL